MTALLERDDWSLVELNESEGYSIELTRVLMQEIAKVRLPPNLAKDKCTVVQTTVLLEIASRLASYKLSMSDDDFTISALDVFSKV